MISNYTKERQKYLGIGCLIVYDENTFLPIIKIIDKNGIMRYYKTTMTDISDNNSIDSAIDKFLLDLRKEKLQKLNEI